MENKNNPEEPFYLKMDTGLKNRANIYIAEAKASDNKNISSMKDLIEEAVHEFMVKHPIK